MKITKTGVSDGGIAIVRFEWKDGAWWELLASLDWGTAKEIRAVIMSAQDGDTVAVDIAYEAQKIRLAGSTEAWSFKLTPTAAALDRLADWRIRDAIEELTRQQQDAEGVVTDEAKKGSPSRWYSHVLRRLVGIQQRLTSGR